MTKLNRIMLAVLLFVGSTALVVSCGGQTAERPSAERAEQVNLALKTAMDFPVASPSTVSVRLMREEYDLIEADYDQYLRRYHDDVLCETPLYESYKMFFPGNQVDPKYLDQWVEATGSAVAYAARGHYKTAEAANARGTDFAANTPKISLQEMTRLCYEAADDLMDALDLNPRLTPAWVALLRLSMMTQMPFSPQEIYSEAIKHDHNSIYLRLQFMYALQPRWGGSYPEMEALAKRAVQEIDLNPRFWSLQGEIYADQANMCAINGDFTRSVELYTKALEYGDKLTWLQYRSYALNKLGRTDEALTDLERILYYDPDHYVATQMVARLRQQGVVGG